MLDYTKQNISIIIVHYKTPLLLLNCLESIYVNTKNLDFEIIIVDNFSDDGSMENVTKLYPTLVWLQNDVNEGFGRANNKGIYFAKSEIILLLNSDTIIINNAIGKLYERFIDEEKIIGMATCQLLNTDFTEQKSVFNYNTSYIELMFYNILVEKILSLIKFKKSNEIKAIHGACMIFNKSRINSIGFFDPDFFMYSEEFEWCYRILKNGLTLKCYEDINIVHLDGGSKKSKDWNIKQRMVSSALLFRKNKGFIGYLFYLLILIFNLLTNLFLLWKMDKNYKKNFIKHECIYFSISKFYFKVLFSKFNKPLKVK